MARVPKPDVKRLCDIACTHDSLHPNSDGLQPTSDGLHPNSTKYEQMYLKPVKPLDQFSPTDFTNRPPSFFGPRELDPLRSMPSRRSKPAQRSGWAQHPADETCLQGPDAVPFLRSGGEGGGSVGRRRWLGDGGGGGGYLVFAYNVDLGLKIIPETEKERGWCIPIGSQSTEGYRRYVGPL